MNRPEEWKIEQGMLGAALPVLDMTGEETGYIYPQDPEPLHKDEKALRQVGNTDSLFLSERKGWTG